MGKEEFFDEQIIDMMNKAEQKRKSKYQSDYCGLK